MSLTFEIKGTLPEHAIRHIIREAETRMADGADAKATLVHAAQEYLAGEHAFTIKTALDEAKSMADMLGGEIDFATALAAVKEQIGAEFDRIVDSYKAGEIGETLPETLAKAAVEAKPVIPMNRGKWLARLGIVKAHIDALVPATTTPSPAAHTEHVIIGGDVAEMEVAQPEITDPDMRAMLGLDAPEVPAPPPFVAGPVDGAAVPPLTNADAPSAVPPVDVPPPPPGVNPRDAFVLFGEALDVDDGALAKRLGVSRSTVHNYTAGKTAKVRVTLAQARMMVAEIDVRVAKLRQAADIFSQVRD